MVYWKSSEEAGGIKWFHPRMIIFFLNYYKTIFPGSCLFLFSPFWICPDGWRVWSVLTSPELLHHVSILRFFVFMQNVRELCIYYCLYRIVISIIKYILAPRYRCDLCVSSFFLVSVHSYRHSKTQLLKKLWLRILSEIYRVLPVQKNLHRVVRQLHSLSPGLSRILCTKKKASKYDSDICLSRCWIRKQWQHFDLPWVRRSHTLMYWNT